MVLGQKSLMAGKPLRPPPCNGKCLKMIPFFLPSCKILNVWCALSREKEGAPFYHCSGLSRISLLINPGMDPDVPVTVFALKLVGELLLQCQCAY